MQCTTTLLGHQYWCVLKRNILLYLHKCSNHMRHYVVEKKNSCSCKDGGSCSLLQHMISLSLCWRGTLSYCQHSLLSLSALTLNLDDRHVRWRWRNDDIWWWGNRGLNTDCYRETERHYSVNIHHQIISCSQINQPSVRNMELWQCHICWPEDSGAMRSSSSFCAREKTIRT